MKQASGYDGSMIGLVDVPFIDNIMILNGELREKRFGKHSCGRGLICIW